MYYLHWPSKDDNKTEFTCDLFYMNNIRKYLYFYRQ